MAQKSPGKKTIKESLQVTSVGCTVMWAVVHAYCTENIGKLKNARFGSCCLLVRFFGGSFEWNASSKATRNTKLLINLTKPL